MELIIRGTVYKSHKEAAESLGVSISAVYRARYKGRLQNLGLGRAGGVAAVPLTLCGHMWPSYTACGKDLGMPASRVRARMQGGVKARQRMEHDVRRWLRSQQQQQN